MPRQLREIQRLEYCLNCNHPVSGNFCANCGQENEDQTVAVKLLFTDFLAELASFDSKLVRTVVPLMIRPGFLTNEYNAGRRVSYLSPLKLYLVTSLVYFLVLSSVIARMSANDLKLDETPPAQTTQKAGVQVGKSGVHFEGDHLPKTEKEYKTAQRKLDAKHRDSPFEQFITRQAIKINNDPKDYLQKVMDMIPKVMFFLLPLFALLLKLVYLRSRRYYVEHLIFALHCHAFVYLILTLITLYDNGIFVALVSLAIFTYFLKAMRVVYKQSRLKTFVKFCLLAGCYSVVLSIFLTLAFVVIFATV